MGFTSDACWFLRIETLVIKNNNKKRDAAQRNEAGGDEKHVFFFTWPKGAFLLYSITFLRMRKSLMFFGQLQEVKNSIQRCEN